MIGKVFEWMIAAVLVLAILPCLLTMIARTLGPLLLVAGAVALAALAAGAWHSRERTPRAAMGRGGAGSERTPVLPEGDK